MNNQDICIRERKDRMLNYYVNMGKLKSDIESARISYLSFNPLMKGTQIDRNLEVLAREMPSMPKNFGQMSRKDANAQLKKDINKHNNIKLLFEDQCSEADGKMRLLGGYDIIAQTRYQIETARLMASADDSCCNKPSLDTELLKVAHDVPLMPEGFLKLDYKEGLIQLHKDIIAHNQCERKFRHLMSQK